MIFYEIFRQLSIRGEGISFHSLSKAIVLKHIIQRKH